MYHPLLSKLSISVEMNSVHNSDISYFSTSIKAIGPPIASIAGKIHILPLEHSISRR
jgi:hypothetical protein